MIGAKPASIQKAEGRLEFRDAMQKIGLVCARSQLAYSMAEAHNIWFQDSDGSLHKRVIREDTIGKAPQVTTDRITMTTGPGTGGLLTVEVELAIRDSQGNVTPGLVVVQLQQ